MREIKSRAWDTKTNSYVEAGFDFRIDGDGYVYRRVWGESQWERTSDLEIEQFTGKQDKEKQDIYDGDKVLWTWSWLHRNIEGIIEWNDKKLRWVITNTHFEHNRQVPLSNYPVKIIGNIHQPELLEKAK